MCKKSLKFSEDSFRIFNLRHISSFTSDHKLFSIKATN